MSSSRMFMPKWLGTRVLPVIKPMDWSHIGSTVRIYSAASKAHVF